MRADIFVKDSSYSAVYDAAANVRRITGLPLPAQIGVGKSIKIAFVGTVQASDLLPPLPAISPPVNAGEMVELKMISAQSVDPTVAVIRMDLGDGTLYLDGLKTGTTEISGFTEWRNPQNDANYVRVPFRITVLIGEQTLEVLLPPGAEKSYLGYYIAGGAALALVLGYFMFRKPALTAVPSATHRLPKE